MVKNTPSPPNKIEELSFEKAISELESIVAELESESHSLDESLALYERGQLLAKHCAALLEKAEFQVKQLSEENLIPFEAEEQ